MNKRPPSGKVGNNQLSGRQPNSSSRLLYKEQEFKELNAALEEKTASLINEAESVLRGQESLFNDTYADDGKLSSSENIISGEMTSVKLIPNGLESSNKKAKQVKTQLRPISASQKKNTSIKSRRPQSSTGNFAASTKAAASPINFIEERATLADRINTLELQAEDEYYTPSNLNENVLPDVVDDMGSDATIRFLKAKLRVMQEELDNVTNNCREKLSAITNMEGNIKELNDREAALMKKNEGLQKVIEKYKSTQNEIRSKNSHLESELGTIRKELESLKRERKQTSAGKNTLEVRLNRALEEAEKHKMALQKSKESTKATSDIDRKRLEQLQAENKRLEKQKTELMTAFKKQLKLIDILKRQKMHIEAAKMLEFSEEEFVRALDWGRT